MNQTGREELAEPTHHLGPVAAGDESGLVAAEDEPGLVAAEDEPGLVAEDEQDVEFAVEECLHGYICNIHSDALGVRQAVHSGAGPRV